MKSPLCSVELDERNQEISKVGSEFFPISAFYNDLNRMPRGEIPLHWHAHVVEVLYMFQGSAYIQVQQETFELHEHEGLFINVNALHAIKKKESSCIFYSFVFSPDLIAGSQNSIINFNYVAPLIQNTYLPYILFNSKEPWQQNALETLSVAFQTFEKGDFGYEILVREQLTRMWLTIVSHHDIHSQRSPHNSIDLDRIKAMMNFIYEHFHEDITLKQIANSANISQRETLRCFQKVLQTPPIAYLLQYRISQAAKLLQDTNDTITEISASCGFEDPSYFAKIFKRYMKETPRNYRKL